MLGRSLRRTLTTIAARGSVSSEQRFSSLLRSVQRQGRSQQFLRTTLLASTRKMATMSSANAMHCYQCEQTRDGVGCFTEGVCGKTADTANLQDMLLYELIALGTVCKDAKSVPSEIKFAMTEALFSTLTNVNFSVEAILGYIKEIQKYRLQVQASTDVKTTPFPVFGAGEHPVDWKLPADATVESALAMEGAFGVRHRLDGAGETLGGLHEFIWYCIKGMGAYATHAHAAGGVSEEIFQDFFKYLSFLGSPECMDLNKTLAVAGEIGMTNVKVLALLDGAHNAKFGMPSPTKVLTSAVPGKCILISGHDLVDLEQLLKETEGKGINVYTHGEMLPAHGYPGLRKYKHLVGNYGTAWQMQKSEFSQFPGSILMTSNCISEPRKSYRDRIFTTNQVGYDGVKHITGEPGSKDFSALIDAALAAPGFTTAQTETHVMTGFGHGTILGMADVLVKLLSDKVIRHVIFVGGCDGSEAERSYFRNIVTDTPSDVLILTAGCGKYRFTKLPLGNIPGTELPRVLDMGQCNDIYGAVVVALKLAEVFKTDVNGLPLSLCVSWFEQKAAACLASALALNIHNIVLGPKLPAFLSADALGVLSSTYGLRAADTERPENDIKRFLGTA